MKNTEKDWQKIGSIEPYYGVLLEDRFLLNNLTTSSLQDFYATGTIEINHILTLASRITNLNLNSAIDFGCGVGRLAFPMTKHAKKVVGIDISDHMLTLAKHNSLKFGVSNIDFTKDIPEGNYDWINSFIVFQHIPPEEGYCILDKLLACLSKNGLISFQFLYKKDAEKETHVSIKKESNTINMSMYDYDLNKVLDIIFKYGIIHTHLEYLNQSGYHSVRIIAIKER